MIRHVRPAVACLAATLLMSAAQAQQATPGAAPRNPAPPAAAPAAPSGPSASHLAAARELASLTGVSSLFDAFLPQFGAQIRQTMVTRPELTNDLNQVLEALKPELEQQKQPMVDLTARYYASVFTEAELKELIAMFKTPIGQKYLQSAPRILDALAIETQRWTSNVAEFLMTRVRAEMGKRGHQM